MGKSLSLFGPGPGTIEALAQGAVILRGFADPMDALTSLRDVLAAAPLRHMSTPGGFTMSVAMTSCGEVGWVSDRKGYRYERRDPQTGRCWPAMPELLVRLASQAAARAGFAAFVPDSCLVNRYACGTRLSLHQDRNERDFSAPIVSVSLGLPAVFLFGGERRSERPRRVQLEGGDVVVWGGPARLAFHGVAPLAEGQHPLTGAHRINLTFRKAL